MKKYIIKIIFAHLLVLSSVLTSCGDNDIEDFNAKSSLYFPNTDGMNMMAISFSNFPDKTDFEMSFTLNLIGQIADEDLEYRLEMIDSLSTAKDGDFVLPEKMIFRKGLQQDTVTILVHKTDHMSAGDVVAVFKIVENENFQPGYFNRQRITLTANNVISKPLWWTKEIDEVYFGIYSRKKYVTFYNFSKLDTIVGLEPFEIREVARNLKEYIRENNIKEEDGSPMVIPCY